MGNYIAIGIVLLALWGILKVLRSGREEHLELLRRAVNYDRVPSGYYLRRDIHYCHEFCGCPVMSSVPIEPYTFWVYSPQNSIVGQFVESIHDTEAIKAAFLVISNEHAKEEALKLAKIENLENALKEVM